MVGVKCPACLQRERAASKGTRRAHPLGKGGRSQPPQARDGSGNHQVQAPGLAFVNSLDRQAFICMKIDFRKPLKCNKKVFNAPVPTELISTSLLDLSFLFLRLPSLGIALLHKQPIWKTAQPGNT